MLKRKAIFFLLILVGFKPCCGFAQFKFGGAFSIDVFQQYYNPIYRSDSTLRNSENILLNPVYGPKCWFGKDNFSMSLEVAANWGITSYCRKQNKGLGAISFPILTKFNFGGLSGITPDKEWGVSVGGGIQFCRTELYGLKSNYDNITYRMFFPVYVIEIDIGSEIGFSNSHSDENNWFFFVRYGVGRGDATAFHIGVGLSGN